MLSVMEHSYQMGLSLLPLNEQWDPVLEQTVFRKMPSGYGGFSQNWITDQTENLDFGTST